MTTIVAHYPSSLSGAAGRGGRWGEVERVGLFNQTSTMRGGAAAEHRLLLGQILGRGGQAQACSAIGELISHDSCPFASQSMSPVMRSCVTLTP